MSVRLAIDLVNEHVANVVDQRGTVHGHGFRVEDGIPAGDALRLLWDVFGPERLIGTLERDAEGKDDDLSVSVQTLRQTMTTARATKKARRA